MALTHLLHVTEWVGLTLLAAVCLGVVYALVDWICELASWPTEAR